MDLLLAITKLAVGTVLFVYGTAFIISLATASGVYFTTNSSNWRIDAAGPDREMCRSRFARRGRIAAGIWLAVALPIALATQFG